MTAPSSWPPSILTPVDPGEIAAGDGLLVARFIDAFGTITSDTVAGRTGSPLELRDWQRDLLGHLFARRADGRRKHRTALVGLPRKNGKSALGALCALYGLLAEGHGAEVYSAATSRDQAKLVFGMAKRMVEASPELSGACKVYRNSIEVPSTGSIYKVVSAEAGYSEGLSPTLVVYDELHAAPNSELWDVLNLGSGARVDPLVLAITTAGVKVDSTGQDSTAYQLFQHAQRVASGEVVDPSFFCAWWSAPQDARHDDPLSWTQANPGYADLNDPEDFVAQVVRIHESEFRTKRLNQWVNVHSAWLPTGAFETCEDKARNVDDGEHVVLGFDGSYTNDSTALVGCTLDGHLFVVDAWERPLDDPHWRVEMAEVEQAIREACARYRVVEVVCDPYRWQRSMQALEDEGWPVVEWPTNSPARMVPACAKFYDAIMEKRLTHDGDPRLARHVANCVVKTDRYGPRIVKEGKESVRKIDLAVAAVIAFDRACQVQPNERHLFVY